MSIARNILLVSATLVAVGMAVAMATDGDIDWILRGDFFRPADRSVRVAAPATITTNVPSLAAPSLPVVEPVAVVVTVPSANAPTPINTRPIAGEQRSLAQELQGELQRVGCYGGIIDGAWTPLSQKSMRAFMEGVNAQLPTQEPDYVLLALVRGRQERVCSKPCLPDHGPNQDNSCLSKPVPDRAPSILQRPTIATAPSTSLEARAGPHGPSIPAAVIALAPGQLPAVPGAVPLAAQQKAKKARKPEPGLFGIGIFKALFAGGY